MSSISKHDWVEFKFVDAEGPVSYWHLGKGMVTKVDGDNITIDDRITLDINKDKVRIVAKQTSLPLDED